MCTAEQVYELCRLVPAGRVVTYGEIARKLGCPGAARLVGQHLSKNTRSFMTAASTTLDTDLIPCHRVVKRDRTLGGYHGRTDTESREMQRKIELLKAEGIKLNVNGTRMLVDKSAIFTFD